MTETIYILLVAVDMQLKATAILIPRDAAEESLATCKNQRKGEICVQRRKKEDHTNLLVLHLEILCNNGCIFIGMLRGSWVSLEFEVYVE